MSASTLLKPIEQPDWQLGFGQLLTRESKKWWGSRRWLIQSILWLVLLNGLIAFMLFIAPNLNDPEGPILIDVDTVQVSLQLLFAMGGTFIAIGTVIIMQDEVIGEKQSGTAEWILSKPVSRNAFIIAKLVVHALSVLAIMIVLQGAVAYGQILLKGADISLGNFGLGLALLALHTLFYLTLTLMMGVLAKSRGLVLAVPLGAALGGKLLVQLVSQLAWVTPFVLPDLIPSLASGAPVPVDLLTSIVATTVTWSLIFVAIALWQFKKLEF